MWHCPCSYVCVVARAAIGDRGIYALQSALSRTASKPLDGVVIAPDSDTLLTQRLAAIVGATEDALVGATVDGLITEWNPAAERIFGYRPAEVIGLPSTILVPRELRDDLPALYARAFAANGVRHHQTIRVRRDGTRFPVSLTVLPLRDDTGAPRSIIAVVHDLSGERRANSELHALAQRLERERALLAEAEAVARVGSWDLDLATMHILWSDQIGRILETDLGSLTSTTFPEKLHPDDRANLSAAFTASAATGSEGEATYRVPLADGRIKVVESRWRFSRTADGAMSHAIGTCQEVTERHQAQESIRELAATLTQTLESISDGFFTVDLEWRFIYVNGAAERILRLKREELLGRELWVVLGNKVRAGPLGIQLDEAVKTMVSTRREVHAANGNWYDVRCYPSAHGVAVYFRDVTEHHRIVDSLRTFAMRVDSVQDAERAAIAREVHDEIGQSLTALRMDAVRLAALCAESSESRALVQEMTQLIDATLKSTRAVAMSLHPSALEDLGLAAAIEIHVGHVARRAHLRTVLDLGHDSAEVNPQRAAVIYRVLQESLTNVVRHAHATELSVRLSVSALELVLEVTDNGVGIDPDKAEALGSVSLGLLGMRERAAALDGEVTIQRITPRGTRVILQLPADDRAAREAASR